MEQIIHQTRKQSRCPHCGFVRFWRLRQYSRKCKQYRKEWTPTRRITGFHASLDEWKRIMRSFLRDRTGIRVAKTAGRERHRIHRMLHYLRTLMAKDIPVQFSGIVEIDETYIGGQWRNKRWSTRKQGTKRGHGTSKQAVLGILNRDTRCVVAVLVPNLQYKTYIPIIQMHVHRGSIIYTDGYRIYDPLHNWYRHERVEHVKGKYVRGAVHTNSMESFWGYLKRRLKITGGIRLSRLHLHVAEEVWRFNHRNIHLPNAAAYAAMFMAVVVLPTPPF